MATRFTVWPGSPTPAPPRVIASLETVPSSGGIGSTAEPETRQSWPPADSVRPMTDLQGRVIAIAGAGGGLGPVVAQRLADAGAELSLADRSQEIADSVAQRIGLPDERVDPRAVDLLDEPQTDDWAASTAEKF